LSRVPSELLDAELVDASSPRSPYVPVDPQAIINLKKGRAVESDNNQVAAHRQRLSPLNILAISGGGTFGAFDIGVLTGWAETGARPKFDIVTGISTGAFMATFVFLGSEYDEFVRDSYINARAEDVYRSRWWLTYLWSDAIASSQPLRRTIYKAITPEVLQKVAKAHAEGRRLYVGTTNLETHRFVVWDMTAIAASGRPDSLELYRKIVLASGSVPGFLPPVPIEVEVNGQSYEELHVDGGVTTQVFVPMLGSSRDPDNPFFRAGSNVYVICSGKLYADSNTVKRQILPVTTNVLSALLYSNARNDMLRIFDQACLAGMDYHLIAVPQELLVNRNSLAFNPQELRTLYEVGYEMGKDPRSWRHTPPGVEVSEQVLPRTGTTFIRQK
jgi:predicted acylesterase/phospholipase RssA